MERIIPVALGSLIYLFGLGLNFYHTHLFDKGSGVPVCMRNLNEAG